MESVKYYRDRAKTAQQLAQRLDADTAEVLNAMAKDFAALATDLEDGVVELMYPDLLESGRPD